MKLTSSSLRRIAGRIQRTISRVDFAVKIAIKIRNQCQRIIAFQLSPGTDFKYNGEGWLLESLSSDIRRFVEIGANVGQWSGVLIDQYKSTSTGLIFEPGRSMVPLLRSKFGSNPRLEVIEAACGDSHGELLFYEGPGQSEMSSLVPEFTADQGIQSSYPVKLTRVDDEVQSRQWPSIDLLKIDAEGWDLACLRGADRLLSTGNAFVVQFEYGPGWAFAGATLAAALRYLKSHHYTTYLLRSDRLDLYDYDILGEHYCYSNFVAVSPLAPGSFKIKLKIN